MKIKFSKTLAIACVLCMAFATLTAFADVTVVTTTDYDFDRHNDENNTIDMTVTTTVTGLDDNGEITYYVTNGDKIVFIDQKTATGTATSFEFKASYGDVIKAVAKNGSDKGYTGSQDFTFGEGCNYLSNAAKDITETPNNWGEKVSLEVEGESNITGQYVFQGTVQGPVTEYGVKVKLGTDTEYTEFPAQGCDDRGNFAIVIEGLTDTEAATAVKYVK